MATDHLPERDEVYWVTAMDSSIRRWNSVLRAKMWLDGTMVASGCENSVPEALSERKDYHLGAANYFCNPRKAVAR